MTNTNPVELPDDILKENHNLIVIQEGFNYCQANNTKQVGYSDLRRMASDKLNKVTKGFQEVFSPGTFDKIVAYYDKNLDANLRLLEREVVGPKKTLIKFDTFKARTLLEREKLSHSADTMTFEAMEIDESLFIKEEEHVIRVSIQNNRMFTLKEKLKHRQDFDYLVKAAAEIGSNIKSKRWHLSGNRPRNKQFQLSEFETRQIFYLAMTLGKKEMPFHLTIHYDGPPSKEAYDELNRNSGKKEQLVEYFTKWCLLYHKHVVTDYEKERLLDNDTSGQYHRKTIDLYTKFMKFMSNCWSMSMIKLPAIIDKKELSKLKSKN